MRTSGAEAARASGIPPTITMESDSNAHEPEVPSAEGSPLGCRLGKGWLVLGGALLLLIMASVVGSQLLRFSYDDAYITYRYGLNLATGRGFNYNPGEEHLATTTPLYALTLGVLGLLSPQSIPEIGGAISGMALFMAGLAMLRLSHRHGQPLVGLISGVTFISFPMVMETFGGEMIPLIALILWAMVAYFEGRLGLAGFLLGLAALTRGDGLLAVGLVGAYHLISRRTIPWRMVLGFGIPYGLWGLWSLYRYGSPFPGTLDAKLAQGASGMWLPFLSGVKWIFRLYLGQKFIVGPAAHPLFRIYLMLQIPGVLAAFIRGRYWSLPLFWAGLQVVGYKLLGVPFYHWYVVPSIMAMCILVGEALGSLPAVGAWAARRVAGPGRSIHGQVLGTIAALVILSFPVIDGLEVPARGELAIQNEYPSRPYRAVAEWLAEETRPEATVGYLEIGYVGFYSGRKIIDPVGLVTHEALSHVARRDLVWAYREYLPDYILVNPRFDGMLSPYGEEPWFVSCYRAVVTIEAIDVYRRCDSVPPEDLLVMEDSQPANDRAVGEILPDRAVGQTFTAAHDGLRAVALLLANYGREVHGPLIFHLRTGAGIHSGPDLITLQIEMSEVTDNAWRIFAFPPLSHSQGETYYTFLEAPEAAPENAVTAWAASADRYLQGSRYEQHEPVEGDLTFRLYFVREEDHEG